MNKLGHKPKMIGPWRSLPNTSGIKVRDVKAKHIIMLAAQPQENLAGLLANRKFKQKKTYYGAMNLAASIDMTIGAHCLRIKHTYHLKEKLKTHQSL